jgi:EAL domain-containing protein (putative c-di-GMP-specific phosphodiesterase class I)
VPYSLEARQINITASIGISVVPDDTSSGEEAVRFAEIAMYATKASGRNGYKFFDRGMNRRLQYNLNIATNLRKALENNELRVLFQPKISTFDGSLVGLEALKRWESEEMGEISPSTFIPHAEESGAIVAIGEWVFHEVFNQMSEWRLSGLPEVPVAINVSARQLHDRSLVPVLAAAGARYGIPCSQIELELTESAIMLDALRATANLREIRALGVKLSLDDFGTGYSSLTYLRTLPISGVKIDKSFIANLRSEPKDAVIVETVVSLARALGIEIIAEGVEDENIFRRVRSLGCTASQGYFHSEPLPARQITPWLTSKKN